MKGYIIVIKLGTSSIVDEVTHQPLLSILSSVVETVLKLRREGHKVVLVSSGAIGVGLKRMEMSGKPKTLAGIQASCRLCAKPVVLEGSVLDHLE